MTPRQIALKCAEIAENCSGAYATRNAIRAFADTVPDDGVWVPKEPTEKMLDAYWSEVEGVVVDGDKRIAAAYCAMLAAAPTVEERK